MCGICGIIGSFGERTESAVRAMMQAMVHRGPDDDGYEVRPLGGESSGATATFGFRRLAILDLSSAGHQPMVDERTGNCIVFNGEIYNFRSIRTMLAAEGVRFRGTGDTEVLLRALSHWGEGAVDRLDGMFAFAFYEANSRRVLLARDHVGIKPLYVAHLARGVVFASEVRALLASGVVPSDMDPAGIATVLAYGAPQDPLTVHKAIRSFPSGTLRWFGVEVAEGRDPPSARRWWRFPRVGTETSESELVDRIEQVCAETVGEQCVADVPLAVFLSGGMDSALIAALAGREGERVVTFTVGNKTSAVENESEQARETANVLSTSHYETMLDEARARSMWREWLLANDRPCIDGLNQFVVSEAVKSAGNTVALAGLGADELFGGYWTFDTVRRQRRIAWPLDVIPLSAQRMLIQSLARVAPATHRRRIVDLLGNGASYLDLGLKAHRIRDDDCLQALGFDRRALGLTEHWLPPEAYEPFTDINHELFRTVSQVDTFIFMANRMLRDADVFSMNCSLELRVPFLGRRVMDLAGAISGRKHMPPGPARKRLLRRVACRYLPPLVLERPKRGFGLPIETWMKGALRESCRSDMESFASWPGVSRSAVEAEWRAAGEPSARSGYQRKLSCVALGAYAENVRRVSVGAGRGREIQAT